MFLNNHTIPRGFGVKMGTLEPNPNYGLSFSFP